MSRSESELKVPRILLVEGHALTTQQCDPDIND